MVSFGEVEGKQLLEWTNEIREKQAEIDELKKAIEAKNKSLKDLKSELKEAEADRDALIHRQSPKRDPQAALPLGRSSEEDVDSPLESLKISATTIRRLQTEGIERVPDVGKLLRGENEKFPNGPSDIEGMKPDACKKLADAYESWKFGGVPASEANEGLAEAEEAKEPDELAPTAKSPKKPKAKQPKPKVDNAVAPVDRPNDADVAELHSAKIITDVKGSPAKVGEVVRGDYIEADGSFVTDEFLYSKGEFELVTS